MKNTFGAGGHIGKNDIWILKVYQVFCKEAFFFVRKTHKNVLFRRHTALHLP